MNLTRTTLRINADLKKRAEIKALDQNTTLQNIFNKALEEYLQESDKREARGIVFITHDLGEPIDNLSRDDYYPDPKA